MAGPRPRFDPKRALEAARGFTFGGRAYAPGDAFPHPDDGPFADRLLARQYEARAVNYQPEQTEDDVPVEQVTMTKAARNGSYLISAPWFDEPETVRGKVKAEERLAAVRAEGAPLGWIEGGSAVKVEGGEGGWYSVAAPWLDEPERVQGRDAAEARQRELHDEGEPDAYGGYALTEGENGWWEISRGEDENVWKVQGEDNARETIAKLRAGEAVEGQPEEWTAADDGEDGAASDDSGEDAGEQGGEDPAGSDAAADDQTGEGAPAGDEGNQQESDMVDESKKKPEDGDKPNEPGTNQPNGAEVINDRKVSEAQNGDDEGGEDGDEDAGTVGP